MHYARLRVSVGWFRHTVSAPLHSSPTLTLVYCMGNRSAVTVMHYIPRYKILRVCRWGGFARLPLPFCSNAFCTFGRVFTTLPLPLCINAFCTFASQGSAWRGGGCETVGGIPNRVVYERPDAFLRSGPAWRFHRVGGKASSRPHIGQMAM